MHIHTIQLNIEKIVGGTVHMDATEFGAYMSLIIAAYQSKNQLPKDDKRLARMARVSPHKWANIRHVVLEKFEEKETCFEQIFVKKDIQRIESLSKKNKANALKRNDTAEPVAKRSQSQTEANTSIKEQRKEVSKKTKAKKVLKPDGISDQLWGDFETLRKEKKAPITDTALKGIIREAEKLNWTLEQALTEMCNRTWRGFKAQWIINETNQPKGNQHGKQLTHAQRADAAADEAIRILETQNGNGETPNQAEFRHLSDLR